MKRLHHRKRLLLSILAAPASALALDADGAVVTTSAHALTSTAAIVLMVAALGAVVGGFAWVAGAGSRRAREAEVRFESLVQASRQGILIHRARQPLFVNQAYADLLGYESPDEVLALGSTELIYAPHEHARMRAYQDARRAGAEAPAEYEVEALSRDGKPMVLHNIVHTTSWGGEMAMQHNVIDITARRTADRLLRESEERYRNLIEAAPEAIVVLDPDIGRFVDVNENAARLFDMDREALMLLGPAELSPAMQPDGRPSKQVVGEQVAHALAGETPVFRWQHLDRRGSEVPTEVRLVRTTWSGRLLVRGSITDISQRLESERVLTEKSAQLEATLENTDQGIAMMDASLRMVAFNQRFLTLLGFPADRFEPGDPYEKFARYNAARGECGIGDVDDLVAEQLHAARAFTARRMVWTRPDGTVLESRGQPLSGGGMVTTYTDITETHRLSRQLSHQASHDSLTDLLNRREFEDRLARVLESTRTRGSEHAMCYLDLDQFKVINDSCGHTAGDALLRQLGELLRACIRSRDTLARIGGDEFGILLEHCSLDEAKRVCGVLRTTVEELRFSWEGKTFRVGASIGLVPVTAASGSVTDVMSAADTACHAAKAHGNNRIHIYRADDAELVQRQREIKWVVKIQHALEEQRFRLDCQVIAPIGSNAEHGAHFELLLRMQDEAGNTVAPGMFLPAAERYNLMGRLDRWVIGSAFCSLADGAVPIDDIFLWSINLSGPSLVDDDLLEFVVAQLRHTRVPPEKICFEITETAAIANLDRATRFITALKEIGCSFALDDFGSGLSSFAYLKTLPVDFLKIDGMFVKDIVHDPIDFAMVKSINEIGHVMGKRTIAEFVEDDEILRRLGSIGVDYAQGFGVGRPRPLAEIRMLREAS